MSQQEVHPFTTLRRRIRQSGCQFRKPTDNSCSIFYPSEGFQYAYDMNKVERALDEYAESLPQDFQESHCNLTIEEKLIKAAQNLCTKNSDMAVRDFARSVAAYLVMHEDPERRNNPLRLLRTDYLVPVDLEQDSIND
jgi:hypothetical protein